jgi:hypothetical protein
MQIGMHEPVDYACSATALGLFRRAGKFLTNSIDGHTGDCPFRRWRLIAAISSGRQQAMGDAPTTAMEAEGPGCQLKPGPAVVSVPML